MSDSLDFTQKPTVLVVDDTIDNLTLMTALLKDLYRVKVAREVRALQDAAVLYPKAKRILIALDLPAAQASVDGLAIVRASDWLLGAG